MKLIIRIEQKESKKKLELLKGLNIIVKFIQDDCALESEDKAVGRRGLLGGIATLKGFCQIYWSVSEGGELTFVLSLISSSGGRKKSFGA